MMGFDDRLTWLLLGVVIGFFLGYVTRTLREIKEEVHEVDEIVKGEWRDKRSESGAIYLPSWTDIALVVVILATTFAAFQSQAASNKVKSTQNELIKTQRQLAYVVDCNKQLLSEALDVLNKRTKVAEEAAKANLRLQRSQELMFNVLLHVPPYSEDRRILAQRIYAADLKEFIELGNSSEFTAKINRYPEAEDLTDCIEEESGD